MKICRRYYCDNCSHKEVCSYRSDMTRIWDQIEQDMHSNHFKIPALEGKDYPSVAYYSLSCSAYDYRI